MKKLIIAVDFDGTIVEHQYPEIGKIRQYSFDILKQLKEEGHKLILWTCREGVDLENAVIFCKNNGIEFDAVNENLKETLFKTSNKIFYDVLIDDRNLKWNNDCWLDIYMELYLLT